MELEQVKPNKPSFGGVVALSAVTIILIFIAAIAIVTWRAHEAKKVPYTKQPASQLALPPGPAQAA